MKTENNTQTDNNLNGQVFVAFWPAAKVSDDVNQWFENVFPVDVRSQLQQQWFNSFSPLHIMNKYQEYWSFWGATPKMMDEFSLTSDGASDVSIIEGDDEILILADISGIKEEDINLSVSGNNITIDADIIQDKNKLNGNGKYTRTLPLPCQVIANKSKAKYKDGILEVMIPKQQSPQNQKVKVI